MTIVFNSTIWRKERSLVSITGISSGGYVKLESGSIVATYRSDSVGAVTIDVSDLVRMSATGTFTLKEYNSGGTQVGSTETKTWSTGGDINPDSYAIPNNREAQVARVYLQHTAIVLPNLIYNDSRKFDVYGVPAFGYDDVGQQGEFIAATSNGQAEIPDGVQNTYLALYDRVEAQDRRLLQKIEFRNSIQCRTYAGVEWRGRTGAVKRMVWEIRKFSETAADIVGLATQGNAFHELRGAEISAVLHLDGLTAYDLWYYSDIVTSSDVRVNYGAGGFGENSRVLVTENKVDQMDGDAGVFYELNVAVKLKHYDAV